jgi:hypothetical protein
MREDGFPYNGSGGFVEIDDRFNKLMIEIAPLLDEIDELERAGVPLDLIPAALDFYWKAISVVIGRGEMITLVELFAAAQGWPR